MSAPLRVAVIGAGPSGLAAAHRLIEGATPARPVEVNVYESADRAGGGIGTDAIEDFLVERGADGFLAEKPALIDLARRLKIDDRLIRTQPATGGASIVHNGKLVPIPDGFSMMAPTKLRPFLASPLLSPAGRLRALAEVLLPRGGPGHDESLASFVRRRFGPEVLERLAQPLVGGIYGADPELLSLRATMPRFLDEETDSRSVTLGLRRKARGAASAQGARYGLFASFDRGMQVLVDALVNALPAGSLHLGHAVERLVPEGRRVQLTTRGETTTFDHVILALPSRAAARLLAPVDSTLTHRLEQLQLGSCATINLGFDTRAPGLVGYGVVIPDSEQRPSIAMTYASRKWANRAPSSGDLIRVFIGDELAEETDDGELEAIARAELRTLVGITARPRFVVIRRHLAAMPRYLVGHLDRVAAIERRAAGHPWLVLAGNSLRGVGIPDAVMSGEKAAEGVLAQKPQLA